MEVTRSGSIYVLLRIFNRKELMRILHTRRKAEIEVLASSGGCLEESRGASCLVHYVCHKIIHFIEMTV